MASRPNDSVKWEQRDSYPGRWAPGRVHEKRRWGLCCQRRRNYPIDRRFRRRMASRNGGGITRQGC
jgi:hypothetical protein